MKQESKITLTEEQKRLLTKWQFYDKECAKYAGDISSDGPHECAVQNLQTIEKQLEKLGISYSDIYNMLKIMKRDKLKTDISNIKNAILAPFCSGRSL